MAKVYPTKIFSMYFTCNLNPLSIHTMNGTPWLVLRVVLVVVTLMWTNPFHWHSCGCYVCETTCLPPNNIVHLCFSSTSTADELLVLPSSLWILGKEKNKSMCERDVGHTKSKDFPCWLGNRSPHWRPHKHADRVKEAGPAEGTMTWKDRGFESNSFGESGWKSNLAYSWGLRSENQRLRFFFP